MTKKYEGVHGVGGVRVVVTEDGKTIMTTAPFRTWHDAEEWEQEQIRLDSQAEGEGDLLDNAAVEPEIASPVDSTETEAYDPYTDPPILVNAEYFERMPIDTPSEIQEMKRFVVMYTQRAEEHIAHLVRLLGTKGIECRCTETRASPQCLIHLHENLPDD